jgi:hypothetical protein
VEKGFSVFNVSVNGLKYPDVMIKILQINNLWFQAISKYLVLRFPYQIIIYSSRAFPNILSNPPDILFSEKLRIFIRDKF